MGFWTSWILVISLSAVVILTESKKQGVSGIKKVSYRMVSPSSVEIRWRDPSRKGKKDRPKMDGRLFAIRYGSAQDMYRTVATPSRRHVIKGLTPGTVYEFKVRWMKGSRSGAWSKSINVRVPTIAKPNVSIKNLKATPVSSTSVNLSWTLDNPANQKVASISVTARLANGGKRLIQATLATIASSYHVTGLIPNMVYTFMVVPVVTDESSPSRGATTRGRPLTDRPSKPPRLTHTDLLNNTKVQIKWVAPPVRSRNGPLVGYKVFIRKHEGGRRGQSFVMDKSARSFVSKDLEPGTLYKVRISALNTNGTGPASKWVFVKTLHRRVHDDDSDDYEKEGAKERREEEEEKEGKHEGGYFPVERVMDQTLVTRRGHKDSPMIWNEGTTTSGLVSLRSVPEAPRDVHTVAITSTGALIQWSEPHSKPCCPILAYRLTVVDVSDPKPLHLVRGTNKVQMNNLDPATRYLVQVTASNKVGEGPPSKELVFKTLQAVPPVITNLRGARVAEGGNVNLSCVARGDQAPVFTWKVGDDYLNEHNTKRGKLSRIAGKVLLTSPKFEDNGITSSLLLYNVTREAETNFTCVAKNMVGADSQTVSLVVSASPSIVSVRSAKVKVGEASRLECVGKGRPVPDILWKHSSWGYMYKETPGLNNTRDIYVTSSTEAGTFRRSHLVFEKTDLVHGGLYTCIARNEVGRTDASVSLEVEVPPPPPVDDVQAVPVSPTRVSMSWRPPKGYPYPITYYQVSLRKLAQGEESGIIQTRRPYVQLSNLDPDTLYTLGVVAATEHSLGKAESEVKVEVRTLTNKTLKPINVTAVAINSTTVQLDWRTPKSLAPMFVLGYNIYFRSENDPTGKKIFLPGGSSNQFLLKLGKKETYYVRVSTLTTWGIEAFCPWIRLHKYAHAFLPPNAVKDIATVSGLREITLKWKEPVPRTQQRGVDKARLNGYLLAYHDLHQAANITDIRLSARTKTYTIRALAPSTVYVVSLQATNGNGASEPIYVYPTTKSPPPSMVLDAKATPVSSTEIHLQWKHPRRGKVTRYHIRYWRPGRKGKQSAWMSGKLSDYVAGSLKKHRTYRFELIPYDGERPGEAVIIFASTMTDKPDGPPNDVRLTAVNATTLLATWSPPDQDKTNGKIIGYKLVVKRKDGERVANFQVDGSMRKFTFLNMQSSTSYKLRMAAVGFNGTGVFSTAVETSYDNDPQRPAHPENVTINATDNALLLQWEEPNFTGSPIFGYVIGYGQFIPDVFRKVLDGTARTLPITGLKPNSEYIVSVRAFNAIGESLPVFLLARTQKGPALIPPILPPEALNVQSDSLTSLNLTWIDPVTANTPEVKDNRLYQVRYSPIEGEAYSYMNSTNTSLVLKGLKAASRYEVAVRTLRGEEKSDWSMTVVNSTLQLPPMYPPTNIQTFTVPGSPRSLMLKWSPPLGNEEGQAEGYVIHLTPDPTLAPSMWVVLTTDQTEATIRELTPHTVYYLKLQARNKMGYSPLSKMIVHRPSVDVKTVPTIRSVSGVRGNASTTTKVAWEPPEISNGTVTGYMLYYSDTRDRDWVIRQERGHDAVIMGLMQNTTYFFKVRVRYMEELGPFSPVVNFTTPFVGRRQRNKESSMETVTTMNTKSTEYNSRDMNHMKENTESLKDGEIRKSVSPNIKNPYKENRDSDSVPEDNKDSTSVSKENRDVLSEENRDSVSKQHRDSAFKDDRRAFRRRKQENQKEKKKKTSYATRGKRRRMKVNRSISAKSKDPARYDGTNSKTRNHSGSKENSGKFGKQEDVTGGRGHGERVKRKKYSKNGGGGHEEERLVEDGGHKNGSNSNDATTTSTTATTTTTTTSTAFNIPRTTSTTATIINDRNSSSDVRLNKTNVNFDRNNTSFENIEEISEEENNILSIQNIDGDERNINISSNISSSNIDSSNDNSIDIDSSNSNTSNGDVEKAAIDTITTDSYFSSIMDLDFISTASNIVDSDENTTTAATDDDGGGGGGGDDGDDDSSDDGDSTDSNTAFGFLKNLWT